MNPNPTRKDLFTPLALAFSLAAGSSPAQTIHVGGDGTIGNSVLTTHGGTALVGVTGGSWKTHGGVGNPPVSSTLISPAAVVPTTGNVILTFSHRYNFEAGWDGGAVFISINGNPAAYLNGGAFTSNGYVGNTTANASPAWSGGENVFYGDSAGFATPAMITSVANLGTLNAGDTVSVQFKGQWEDANTNPAPNWEIATVKFTDGAATDFGAVNFALGSESGYTVSNVGPPAGPWTFAVLTAPTSFEINGDTLAADRYAPDIPGSVINLANASIVVELLAGTVDPGDTFSLFDLSGGTTLSGTPASVILPALGTWNTSNLAINGTITFVAPPPTLTWNLTTGGAWDTVTANWTADGGVTTTLYADGAKVIFDKAEGGTITNVANRTPFSTTVNSAGNYTFTPSVTPGVPSILGGALIKSGTGTLQLGDTAWTNTANAGTYKNDFTSVQINAGTVRYGSQTALGTGTVTLEDGTTLIKIGQEGNGSGLAMANPLVLNGQTTLRTVFSGIKDQWFSGAISGNGGLKITGERRAITLSGNNSFTGGVIMENYEGTAATAPYNLDIGHVNSLGTGTLTVKHVYLAAVTQFRGLGTIANLSADPGVPNNIVIDTGATMSLGRGQNLRLEGVISGPGAFRKRNTTTVILDGASTFTGGTTVEAGILTLNGSLADSTMTILGGTTSAGTVDGNGTLTFNIDGTTADQISITGGAFNGNLVANGLSLVINPTGAGLTEAEYVLVNATGGGTITGTFAGITGASGYELNYATPNQVKLVKIASGTPYQTWAGTELFANDKNGDGVGNGLAFLLGAASPDAAANHLLPGSSKDGTGLVLEFSMLNAASRGTAKLSLQWSNDLGVTDPWAGNVALVPDDDATVNGVVFDVTQGSPLNKVKATIPSSEAAAGRLFSRLSGTEN